MDGHLLDRAFRDGARVLSWTGSPEGSKLHTATFNGVQLDLPSFSPEYVPGQTHLYDTTIWKSAF